MALPCRRVLVLLAATFAAQAVAYGLLLNSLNAWPTPDVWLSLLFVSTFAAAIAAFRPNPAELSAAAGTTLTVYYLRVVELAYALTPWGRLADVVDSARATAWVAFTRELSASVALTWLWLAIMRCAGRADVAALDRGFGRRCSSDPVADSVGRGGRRRDRRPRTRTLRPGS